MASLSEYLKGLGNDLSEGLGKIPREAMVGVGLGLASGEQGGGLRGMAQGYAAHQQGLQAQEDRALDRQQHDAKMAELNARLEGLQLDNSEKKALAQGRERMQGVLKQNPGISPQDAFRLAAMETGSEEWLQRWGQAEQKEAERIATQEYRDATLGISATNAATNASNARTNQARLQAEHDAKMDEKQRGRDLKTQEMDQQSLLAGAGLEEGERRIDELLDSPGFDQLYGVKGAAYAAAPEWASDLVGALSAPERNDANTLRAAIKSDAVLTEFQQQKAAGVTFGAATEGEWKVLGDAAIEAARPGQTPQQARVKWQQYKERRRRFVGMMQEDLRKQRDITSGQTSGAPAPASAGAAPRRDQLKAGTRVGNFIYDGQGDPGDRNSWKPAQ